VYDIKQRKKKVEDLSRQLETLIEKYDVKKIEEKKKDIQERIKVTDEETVVEKFKSDQLEHAIGQHEQDIQCIKMKIERWKEIMRRLALEEAQFTKDNKVMKGKINKFYTVLERDKNTMLHEGDIEDSLFNQNI
jgi:hypothetical protein